MSLRISMVRVDGARLRSVLQGGDPSLKVPVLKRIHSSFLNAAARERAESIATAILDGNATIETEDDVVASVVVCIAKAQQNLNAPSIFSFWDELLNRAYQSGSVPNEWAPLYNGRPEVGKRLDSSWAVYALLSSEEAAAVFRRVREYPNVAEIWEFTEASEWMNAVEEAGCDVLFFAS